MEQEAPKPDIEFDQLTPDQQRLTLFVRSNVARQWMEELAQDPDATEADREEARQRKALADQTLIDFRIEHGEIVDDPTTEP